MPSYCFGKNRPSQAKFADWYWRKNWGYRLSPFERRMLCHFGSLAKRYEPLLAWRWGFLLRQRRSVWLVQLLLAARGFGAGVVVAVVLRLIRQWWAFHAFGSVRRSMEFFPTVVVTNWVRVVSFADVMGRVATKRFWVGLAIYFVRWAIVSLAGPLWVTATEYQSIGSPVWGRCSEFRGEPVCRGRRRASVWQA